MKPEAAPIRADRTREQIERILYRLEWIEDRWGHWRKRSKSGIEQRIRFTQRYMHWEFQQKTAGRWEWVVLKMGTLSMLKVEGDSIFGLRSREVKTPKVPSGAGPLEGNRGGAPGLAGEATKAVK